MIYNLYYVYAFIQQICNTALVVWGVIRFKTRWQCANQSQGSISLDYRLYTIMVYIATHPDPKPLATIFLAYLSVVTLLREIMFISVN